MMKAAGWGRWPFAALTRPVMSLVERLLQSRPLGTLGAPATQLIVVVPGRHLVPGFLSFAGPWMR